MIADSWIEISRDAIVHNIALITKIAGDRWAAVVKGNAYGHGLALICELLIPHRCISMLVVSSGSDALALRSFGWKRDILVLSHLDIPCKELIQENIAITLYDRTMWNELRYAAVAAQRQARIHIALDTGMHHIGILPSKLAPVIQAIRSSPEVLLEGIWTHLPHATTEDDHLLRKELESFRSTLFPFGLSPRTVTLHARASRSAHIQGYDTIARIGTLLYGSWKSDAHEQIIRSLYPHSTLLPIASLKSRILQIKQIEADEYVGYNRIFRASRKSYIGIVAAGYYEGYSREHFESGIVFVDKQPCPIVGMISMNMMAIDLTDLATQPNRGDAVLLMGPHPQIAPRDLAHRISSNPNAITTALHYTIRRSIR